MTEFELQVLARLDAIGDSLVGRTKMRVRTENRLEELRVEEHERRVKQLQARMRTLGYVGGPGE